jgi:hypothetical protein
VPSLAEIAAELTCAEVAVLIDSAVLRAGCPAKTVVHGPRDAAIEPRRRVAPTAARTARPYTEAEHEYETDDDASDDRPTLHDAASTLC